MPKILNVSHCGNGRNKTSYKVLIIPQITGMQRKETIPGSERKFSCSTERVMQLMLNLRAKMKNVVCQFPSFEKKYWKINHVLAQKAAGINTMSL